MPASAAGVAAGRHTTRRPIGSGAARVIILSAMAFLGVCAQDSEVKLDADNLPVADSVEESPSRAATGMWTFVPVSHQKRYSTHLTVALVAAVTLIVVLALTSAKKKLEEARQSLEQGQKAHIEELARARKEKKEALEEARQQLERAHEEKMKLQEQVDMLVKENKELQKLKEKESPVAGKRHGGKAPTGGKTTTGGKQTTPTGGKTTTGGKQTTPGGKTTGGKQTTPKQPSPGGTGGTGGTTGGTGGTRTGGTSRK